MWRNYLTVGIRALAKNRTYAFINILGLAIGLAACLMLLIYVRYETSYDEWLPNAENTYQFQSHYRDQADRRGEPAPDDLLRRRPAAQGRFPAGRSHGLRAVDRAGHHAQRRGAADRGRAARRQSVPRRAAIPARPGRSADALARSSSVVLTETEARRLFGAENPMGRTLTMVSRGISTRLSRHRHRPRPAAQLAHALHHGRPRSTSPAFIAETPDFLTSWGWQSGWFYFTLRPGTDPAAIQRADAGLGAAQHPDRAVRQPELQRRATSRIGGSPTSAASTSATPRRRR